MSSPDFKKSRKEKTRPFDKKRPEEKKRSASRGMRTCVRTSFMDIASPIFIIIGAFDTLAPIFSNSNTYN